MWGVVTPEEAQAKIDLQRKELTGEPKNLEEQAISLVGRDIYENISRIVDEIFNNYVVRQGRVDPFFTAYCNGTTTVCDGLSQWETVALAEQGLTPYQILQKF